MGETIKCEICGKDLRQITATHLNRHNMTTEKYMEKFPNSPMCIKGIHKHSESSKRRMSESHKGKPLSEEHRRLISEGNKGRVFNEETLDKIRKANTGHKMSEETKQKLREYHLGRTLSPESRKKVSDKLKGRFCGKEHPSYGKQIKRNYKGVVYTRIWDDEDIYLRSSWELLVAHYLDSKSIRWEYEHYTYNLGTCMYTPDFFIVGEKNNLLYLIEVKGWMDERSKTKINLFRELYPNTTLEVWDRAVLIHKGLLNK